MPPPTHRADGSGRTARKTGTSAPAWPFDSASVSAKKVYLAVRLRSPVYSGLRYAAGLPYWVIPNAFPLTAACFQQGPFAPRALPRCLARTGLSDSPPGPRSRLFLPGPRWARCHARPEALPGSSTDLSKRAAHNHPGKPAGCMYPSLHHRSRLVISVRLLAFRLRNEAESGSLALRLACSPHRFPPDGLLRPAPVQLLVRTSNLHGELLSVYKISQVSWCSRERQDLLNVSVRSASLRLCVKKDFWLDVTCRG